MGAGSTGIAALAAGYDFVGIELENQYFDDACLRIEAAQQQAQLFEHAAPAAPEQAGLAI